MGNKDKCIRWSLFWLYFVGFINNYCMSYDLPEVDTPLGKIIGSWQQSFDGRKYAAYEGIPYAKPPIGDLRFEEPEPAEPWVDVLNATKTYSCPQNSFTSIDLIPGGNEDCLYLNVYRPFENVDLLRELDVLVGIHGGGFMWGSGHTFADSKIFMDRDIILVSINYRLGILGFLSTEDEVIPGNNGMKDQVLALQWVKDNIASFGGNPNSVTIAGISAGGASVHLHYFSPWSKGLFVRGLAQSGTAVDPWVIKERPLENARKLAALVGCDGASTRDMKACLKGKSLLNIFENLKYFYGYDNMPFSPFAPVVEKNTKKPFLAKHPFSLLKEGEVLDVPLVVSTTADEGLLPAAMYHGHLEKIDEEWSNIAHYFLDYNYTLPISKREDVARKIKEFYLGPGEQIDKKNFKKFTQIFTDRLFLVGGELAARLQAKATKSPVYYYLFNYKEGENKAVHFFAQGNDVEGVSHGEDGLYFYGIFLFKELSKKDLRMKNACQDMLYSYVTTGVPSFDGTDQWKPTDASQLTYLNITSGDDMKLENRHFLSPIKFWKDLGLLEEEIVDIKDEL